MILSRFGILSQEGKTMFKKMYLHLFNTITNALEENDVEKIKEILKNGQIETEEMYINGSEE